MIGAIDTARRLMAQRRFEEARATLEKALRGGPAQGEFAALLGMIALEQKRPEDAERLLGAAIAGLGASADVLNARSIALVQCGRGEEAVEVSARVVELRGEWGPGWMQKGLALGACGRHAEAVTALERACAISPESAKCWYNLGVQQTLAGRAAEAVRSLKAADERAPGQAMVLAALGTAILEAGSVGDALTVLRRAVAVDGKSAEALGALGKALVEGGLAEEGCGYLERALEIGPASLARRQVLVTGLNYGVEDPARVRRVHEQFAARWDDVAVLVPVGRGEGARGERFEGHDAGPTPRPPPSGRGRTSGERLRVAFLSQDLREHSCSYFLEPLLAGLGSQGLEVWAVSATSKRDAVTARLKGLVDGWIDVAGVRGDEAAGMVRDAGIDVLIECSGHTTGHRLDICARRPAAVQMTFLGYPATTGLGRIDYRLVDWVTDPAGSEGHCTEKLLRVEGCLWCFRPRADAPEVGAAPIERNGYLTLGSFNMLPKISERTVALWSAAMRAVPSARLVMKNLRVHDAATMAWVRGRFGKHGVSGERIEAAPFAMTTAEHLRVYDRVDVQVDPTPYNGTTTTCESLWQGVPVVGVEGRVHASRVTMSLMGAVGLGEMVAADEAGFVRVIKELAETPGRLAELRAGLRPRMAASPLRDEAGYVQRFAAAVREAGEGIGDRG